MVRGPPPRRGTTSAIAGVPAPHHGADSALAPTIAATVATILIGLARTILRPASASRDRVTPRHAGLDRCASPYGRRSSVEPCAGAVITPHRGVCCAFAYLE